MSCTGFSRRHLAIVLFGCLFLFPDGQLAAQMKVKAAGSEEKKSSPAALTMYSDAANYQNNQAFELAADEWTRFLGRFGQDPLASKAQHYLGVCQKQLRQYAKAVAAFQSVVDKYPTFELLEETYLNLGWCQYSLAEAGDKGLYSQAAATFAKLAKDYPKGTFADQALFYQGEAYYALTKRKEAAMAYGRLATGYKTSRFRPDALYALGVTLEEMGEWAQAFRAYEMFLDAYDKHELATEVRMRFAETILQQGDAEKAEAMFAEVVAVDGFESADHALYRQAYCAARQEKLADAGALYAALAQRFPKSSYLAESLLSAGRCYYRADEFGDAAGMFERVIAMGGSQAAEAAHWLSRILLRNGEMEKVLKLVEDTLPNAGNSPFAANLKLDKADALYESEGRRADSLKEYLATIKAHPEHDVASQAMYYAAFAALNLQQYAQAKQLVDQFLEKYPNDPLVPDAHYVAAECHIQEKEYSKAESIYRELVKEHADHSEYDLWRIRLGLVIYLKKQYQDAVELLTPLAEKLKSSDLKAEAFFLVGVSQFRLTQYAAAAKSLQAALSANAKWRQADETLLYLSRTQRKSNQLDEAEATIKAMQKSFPQSQFLGESYYFLGEYCFAAGKYTEAIPAYDQVIENWSKSAFVPFSTYGKGWSLLKTRQYDQAAQCFSTLIDRKPVHQLRDEALLARGMCYRQLKKHTEAIADIDQYLASKPDSAQRADALYERGLAEVAAKKLEQAVKTFSVLRDDHGQYAGADKVLYELGWAYKSLAKDSAGVESFAALAEKHPDSPLAAEANFHVAEDLYAKKEFGKAIETYGRAVEKTGDAVLREKTVHKLGWAQYRMKQYEQALAQFDRQLNAYPEGDLAPDGWFMKGECLFNLEDYEKALPAFLTADRSSLSSPQMVVLLQLHAGQTAGQIGKWEQSLELLDAMIKEFPDSSLLAEAYFERGRAKQKLDQLGDAIADFRQAAERSRGPVGARAQFMVGEIYFQQKKFDEAIKDFQRVMFRVGPEGADAELRNWQAKAGYEAARCCEVQIQQAKSPVAKAERIADAKKFYRYVVDEHPKNELAALAKKRLEELAKL